MQIPPDKAANQFYASLMQSQCHVCWGFLSNESQNKFAQWTLEELQRRNPEACAAAEMGVKEVKLLFERNDSLIMKFFWRRFFFASGANELYRLGYFSVHNIEGSKATVRVHLKYPNGQEKDVALPMVKQRGGWRLAYVENNLPF